MSRMSLAMIRSQIYQAIERQRKARAVKTLTAEERRAIYLLETSRYEEFCREFAGEFPEPVTRLRECQAQMPLARAKGAAGEG